jgi:hypothetical protein
MPTPPDRSRHPARRADREAFLATDPSPYDNEWRDDEDYDEIKRNWSGGPSTSPYDNEWRS